MGQADGRAIGCTPMIDSGKYSASTGHKIWESMIFG
jgi:hypothetical protein